MNEIGFPYGDRYWFEKFPTGIPLIIREFKNLKSQYTETIINKKETLYKDDDITIHTINGVIESINDEPAIIAGNIKYWFKNNKHHREFGPAISFGGHNELFYFYENYNFENEEEFINFQRSKKLKEILDGQR